jgi:hypothetical protein
LRLCGESPDFCAVTRAQPTSERSTTVDVPQSHAIEMLQSSGEL